MNDLFSGHDSRHRAPKSMLMPPAASPGSSLTVVGFIAYSSLTFSRSPMARKSYSCFLSSSEGDSGAAE